MRMFLALLLCGCVDQSATTVISACGPAPSPPKYAVSYAIVNGVQKAVLAPSDYEAIQAWDTAVIDWQSCVLNQP